MAFSAFKHLNEIESDHIKNQSEIILQYLSGCASVS